MQNRLLQWTNDQHKRRVFERNVAISTKPLTPFTDKNDNGHHRRLRHSGTRLSQTTHTDVSATISSPTNTTTSYKNKQLNTATGTEDDIINPLIHRRKELLRQKSFSFTPSKGTLGFDVDPSKTHLPERKNNVEENDNDDDYDDEDELEEIETNESFLQTSSTREYLSHLQKTFDQQVLETTPNNYQIQKLYLDAKHADQAGNIPMAKIYLYKLLQVTPKDTRVTRRLARLEMEEGNMEKAREILQSGLRHMPQNADLLHGLGVLESKCDNMDSARNLYKKAIKSRTTFANPYHALATLEHSQGNIRIATAVLRAGLTHCPSNHRLHHALGDLYRDAKMLDMADKEYRKGIKCLEAEERRTGKDLTWCKSFFYTGLSYISYEVGNKYECRQWLRKSVDGNNQMHSQGW